jgi:hypothetical protein
MMIAAERLQVSKADVKEPRLVAVMLGEVVHGISRPNVPLAQAQFAQWLGCKLLAAHSAPTPVVEKSASVIFGAKRATHGIVPGFIRNAARRNG